MSSADLVHLNGFGSAFFDILSANGRFDLFASA